MITGGVFQPLSSQTLLGVVGEYIIDTPFCKQKLSCNPNIKKSLGPVVPSLVLSDSRVYYIVSDFHCVCPIFFPLNNTETSKK
jgi:hypothetical protein